MNTERVVEVLQDPIDNSKDYWEASQKAIEALKFQASVVRCRDCRYKLNGICSIVSNKNWKVMVGDNCFCDFGKRRDEE